MLLLSPKKPHEFHDRSTSGFRVLCLLILNTIEIMEDAFLIKVWELQLFNSIKVILDKVMLLKCNIKFRTNSHFFLSWE